LAIADINKGKRIQLDSFLASVQKRIADKLNSLSTSRLPRKQKEKLSKYLKVVARKYQYSSGTAINNINYDIPRLLWGEMYDDVVDKYTLIENQLLLLCKNRTPSFLSQFSRNIVISFSEVFKQWHDWVEFLLNKEVSGESQSYYEHTLRYLSAAKIEAATELDCLLRMDLLEINNESNTINYNKKHLLRSNGFNGTHCVYGIYNMISRHIAQVDADFVQRLKARIKEYEQYKNSPWGDWQSLICSFFEVIAYEKQMNIENVRVLALDTCHHIEPKQTENIIQCVS